MNNRSNNYQTVFYNQEIRPTKALIFGQQEVLLDIRAQPITMLCLNIGATIDKEA